MYGQLYLEVIFKLLEKEIRASDFHEIWNEEPHFK
jgi:hypothetical protein